MRKRINSSGSGDAGGRKPASRVRVGLPRLSSPFLDLFFHPSRAGPLLNSLKDRFRVPSRYRGGAPRGEGSPGQATLDSAPSPEVTVPRCDVPFLLVAGLADHSESGVSVQGDSGSAVLRQHARARQAEADPPGTAREGAQERSEHTPGIQAYGDVLPDRHRRPAPASSC